MEEQELVDLDALGDLCTPWCLRVAATLRVAEQMAAGLSRAEDLAQATGSDANYLARVLRHLVGKGLFREPAPGEFVLNEAGRALCDPQQRIGLDLDGIGGRMAYAWGSLPAAVRKGSPAYDQIFGRSFWDDLDAHPAIARSFDELLGPQGHGTPDPEILIDGDWGQVRTVVDVAGGTGIMLAEILRTHPGVRGILVDLPRTVARSGEIFAAAGVSDRVTASGQSFFEPLPAGADLYLFKNALADWADGEARLILQRMAEAARPDGRVVILGGIVPDEEPRGGEGDLLMLILVGGKERTLSEFRQLAGEAGLEVSASGRLPSGRFVVECRDAAELMASE